jgi:CcmD family protein
MTNPGYLFAGFALAWALTFVYLWMLSRQTAAVQKQLEALERRLDKSGASTRLNRTTDFR